MKKRSSNRVLKSLGFVGALFLVAFGSANNFWRTVKLAWAKLVHN